MLDRCTQCGNKVYFSPKHKGNVCSSCASVFPIKYDYQFDKKNFANKVDMTHEDLEEIMKSIRCKSCGATVLYNKFEIQTTCPYCGNSDISKITNKKLMYIDSIIPFAIDKEAAYSKLKSAIRKRFSASRRVFKNIDPKDIKGAYINAFVFDLITSSPYRGVFSYKVAVLDNEGKTQYITKTKNVSGVYDKSFKNITVEANSNLNQQDLVQILPFDYTSAVKFNPEFVNGYMIEYQDRVFDDCYKIAESIIRRNIEKSLIKDNECEKVDELELNVQYVDRQFNYCLLPVYFITSVIKDKKYTAVINGQTGKVGKLPTNPWRIFLTILMTCGLIVAIVLALIFL